MRKGMSILLVAAVIGCDGRGVVAPNQPTAPSRDLVQAGNGHFFFLPPLAPNPVHNGEFNPDFAPVVEVCLKAETACVLVARFTLTTAPKHVTMELNAQRYDVDWDTHANPVLPGVYQISVRSAPSSVTNTLLGSVDVVVTPTSDAAPTDMPWVLNGNTLRIAFRIEKGALCAADECIEKTVDNSGGNFTRDDSLAGAYFPPGAIPDDAGEVNFVIERFTDHSQACLPTDYPQYEGCYRFRTEPHITFDEQVTVGICLDPAAVPIQDQLELQKWNEVDPSTLVTLPRVSVDFLACDGFAVSQAKPSGFTGVLARSAQWFLSPVSRLLRPTPAYASVISPYGGRLSDFSRIGWVRPLKMTGHTPGGMGTSFTPNYSVDVTSKITGAPISGVPVSWNATAPSYATPPNGTTDGAGTTSSLWTLAGSPPGAYSLTAIGANPRPFWPGRPGNWGSVTFNAVVAAPVYHALFLSPLGTITTGTTHWNSSMTPSVTVCKVVAGACTTTAATFPTLTVNTATRSYQVTWNVPSTLTKTTYRFTVKNGTTTLGSVDAAAVITKVSTYQFAVGKPLLIKFSIEP